MAHNWILSNIYQEVSENAVKAGNDSDGCEIYIGRAKYSGDWCIAKIIPSKQQAFICYNMVEISITDFEVLTGSDFEWIVGANGEVPLNAIKVNQTSRSTIFVGRTKFEGLLVPGKIESLHKCIYVPYEGSEIAFKQYEVLTQKPKN